MIANIGNKVGAYKLAGVPVGNALELILGVGAGGGLNDITKSFLPVGIQRYGGLATGFGWAWVFQRAAVKRFLGDYLADALSIGAIFHAVDSTFLISGKISGTIAGLSQKVAGPVATARATQTAAPTQAETGAPQQFVSSVNEKLRATLEVA